MPDNITDKKQKVGILLTNLGTPDAPTKVAVRRYLAEFLSDPRIIKIPKPLRMIILYGFILPFRPSRTAKAYIKIWTAEGSPLLVICKKIADRLQVKLDSGYPDKYEVVLGMRYGNPSVESTLFYLKRQEYDQIIVLPLYPQYSETTTASTMDIVKQITNKLNWHPEIKYIKHYYDNPDYISALSESIRRHRKQNKIEGILIFSFHGIPKQYADEGDPYPVQCKKTAALVAKNLNLAEDKWIVTFQSRLGPREWLKPYTELILESLARKGISSVEIICPGFSADCLETLEEINIRYRKTYNQVGGENFSYIPSLNDTPEHIGTLCSMVLAEYKEFG